MRTRAVPPIAAAMGIVCAGTAAHADTTDDIKNASQMYMNYAHATLDGVATEVTIQPFSKPAGTLTFDIPASALGFPLTGVSLHAVGTSLGNGKIAFATGNTYDPPVALDDAGTTLSSESGTFTMQTWSLGGADTPDCGAQKCAGGTGFQILGGTLTVTGSFGAKVATLDEVRGIGGVQRAAMAGLHAPPVHLSANGSPDLPFCSGTSETHALMKVELATPAPAGGTRVDLSSPTAGVRFLRTAVVAQGRDTAIADVVVPPGFTGTLELTAAAGGQLSTATLAVNAASTCRPPAPRYGLEPIANPLTVGCAGCSASGALNNEGDQIIAVNGVVEFAHAGAYTSLARQLGASAVSAVSIDDAGLIAGSLTLNGVTQAYRADMLHGAHAPVLLGQMTPAAITQGGAVLGFRVDPATGNSIPVINRGFGVVDIPVSSPNGVTAARALFMTQDATIVGTYTGTDGIVRGYRFLGGTTSTLPTIGRSWAIPAGVAADGSIAVNAGPTAAVIAPGGTVTQYGVPRGYVQFAVKGINKWGYAIGIAIATCTPCTSVVARAFVYIPGTGFTALSGYVSNLAYADDALAINDDNQIVIHGELTADAGVAAPPPDYYLLSL
jgi:hypothetical protein